MLKILNLKFLQLAPNNILVTGLSEIALAGKSNVGKSSFINTMINRKNLARTSSEPGKTRQLNFYNIDEQFYFVDLPGYGYSKMSKAEQDKVGKFTENYIINRNEISLIILLIDIRHAHTENDKHMYNYVLNSGRPFVIVATKADKIAITKVNEQISNLRNILKVPDDIIIFPFSSERKIYSEIIWREIEKYTI